MNLCQVSHCMIINLYQVSHCIIYGFVVSRKRRKYGDRRVLWHEENLQIAKSINSCQPAPTTQADMSRYFLQKR